MSKKEIAIVTADDIRGRIFLVRGHKVMLDADLAAIYGYETKYFNRQVSNNHEIFEGDAQSVHSRRKRFFQKAQAVFRVQRPCFAVNNF